MTLRAGYAAGSKDVSRQPESSHTVQDERSINAGTTNFLKKIHDYQVLSTGCQRASCQFEDNSAIPFSKLSMYRTSSTDALHSASIRTIAVLERFGLEPVPRWKHALTCNRKRIAQANRRLRSEWQGGAGQAIVP
eukprot:6199763-Pleurochrysis_carterae.AAC.1